MGLKVDAARLLATVLRTVLCTTVRMTNDSADMPSAPGYFHPTLLPPATVYGTMGNRPAREMDSQIG